MARPRSSAKSAPPGLLERLSPQEAVVVLGRLLERHPELRPEAEQLATEYVSSSSTDEIAQDVYDRITSIGMDELGGRAGKHRWGYVEPGEAAIELMDESLQDLADDMKRSAELGLVLAAQAVCAGIVQGLYQTRHVHSDGALGWAPDFPAEHAGYMVEEFLRACSPAARKEAKQNLEACLPKCAPEWTDGLMRACDNSK
jgi:hypothetical protein